MWHKLAMKCGDIHVMGKLIILTEKVLQGYEGAGISAGPDFKV